MPKIFAFLRAINVGGRNVAMAALRSHFEDGGLASVESFIASGNIVFDAPAAGLGGLEKQLETRLEAALGYPVSVFLRTNAELTAIVNRHPFAPKLLAEAVALNVAFLAQPPGATGVAALKKLASPIDEFHLHGRELYWLCRQKQSDSKFSNQVLEKALGTRSTIRTCGMLQKMAARFCGEGQG